ncbi:uncharacterized protein L201_003719 [Kwoniella dendrophila CBS 6074]|uniref:Uncharacterized protein n=1 Tax=Kwoniella dendrophila CBS 6074 TaxID=1295534 RepID=A0AAX4JUD3_9TREE
MSGNTASALNHTQYTCPHWNFCTESIDQSRADQLRLSIDTDSDKRDLEGEILCVYAYGQSEDNDEGLPTACEAQDDYFPIKSKPLINDYRKSDTTLVFREHAFAVLANNLNDDVNPEKQKYAGFFDHISQHWNELQESGEPIDERTKYALITNSLHGGVLYPNLEEAYNVISKITTRGEDNEISLTPFGEKAYKLHSIRKILDSFYGEPSEASLTTFPDMIESEAMHIPNDIKSDLNEIYQNTIFHFRNMRQTCLNPRKTFEETQESGFLEPFWNEFPPHIHSDGQADASKLTEAKLAGDTLVKWSKAFSATSNDI